MMRVCVNVSAKPRCASTIIHLIQTDKLQKILHAMHCFACPANRPVRLAYQPPANNTVLSE
jgi:hypothetical protein